MYNGSILHSRCFIRVEIKMEVIDSCADRNGGCDHECRHSLHGPICTCHYGHRLLSDQRSCEGNMAIYTFINIAFVSLFGNSLTRHSSFQIYRFVHGALKSDLKSRLIYSLLLAFSYPNYLSLCFRFN